MKALILAAAVLVGVGVALPASAADTTASVGYSSFKFKKAQFDAISGRIAWTSGMFGVEGQLSTGVADANHFVGPNNVNMELNYEASIYATATWPIAENMDAFGRAGVGTTKIKANLPTAGLDGDDQSFNIGVGGDWYFYDRTGIRAEYTREIFGDYSSDADVWSVSLTHKF